MEILKGFSFDIQMFAVDLTTIATAIVNGGTPPAAPTADTVYYVGQNFDTTTTIYTTAELAANAEGAVAAEIQYNAAAFTVAGIDRVKIVKAGDAFTVNATGVTVTYDSGAGTSTVTSGTRVFSGAGFVMSGTAGTLSSASAGLVVESTSAAVTMAGSNPTAVTLKANQAFTFDNTVAVSCAVTVDRVDTITLTEAAGATTALAITPVVGTSATITGLDANGTARSTKVLATSGVANGGATFTANGVTATSTGTVTLEALVTGATLGVNGNDYATASSANSKVITNAAAAAGSRLTLVSGDYSLVVAGTTVLVETGANGSVTTPDAEFHNTTGIADTYDPGTAIVLDDGYVITKATFSGTVTTSNAATSGTGAPSGATVAYTTTNAAAQFDGYTGAVTNFTTGTIALTKGGVNANVSAFGGTASFTGDTTGDIVSISNARVVSAAAGANHVITGKVGGDSVALAGTAVSTLTADASGELTLINGNFAAPAAGTLDVLTGTGNTVNIAAGQLVFQNSSAGTIGATAAELTKGKLTANAYGGTINGVTYTGGGTALQFAYVNNKAMIYSTQAAVTAATTVDASTGTSSNATIYVSDANGTKTSELTLANRASISVNSATGQYTLGLATVVAGDTITIDGKEFTVSVSGGTASLTSGTETYTFTGTTNVTLNIADGTTSFTDTFDTAYVYSDTTRTVTGTLNIAGADTGVATTVASALGNTHTAAYKEGDKLYANAGVTSFESVSGSRELGTLNYNDSTEVHTYTVNSNGKAQFIEIKDTNVWSITGGSGNDTLVGNGRGASLNGGAGNDTITASAGDLALGGEGKDSLVAAGNGVSLTGGEGVDLFDISSTGVGAELTDYVWSEDIIAVGSAVSVPGSFNFGDGVVTVGGSTASLAAQSSNMYVAKFQNGTNKQYYAWANSEGGMSFDASTANEAFIVKGDTNSDISDTVVGSAKADTIYAGANDSINAGAGADQIVANGANIQIAVGTTTGKDMVTGFVTGFDTETADSIFALDGSSSDVSASLASGNVTIKDGKGSVQLTAAKTASGATVGNTADVLFNGRKFGVIAANSTYTVTDADSVPEYFLGSSKDNLSGVDYSALEDDVTVWFAQDANDAKFRNIGQVTGGKGNSTLLGGSSKETLIATAGNTTLCGAEGNDSLVGNANSNDVFAVFAGYGSDTISSFQSYNADAETNDYLWFNEGVSAKRNSSGNAVFTTASGAKATVVDTNVDTKFVYTVNDSVNVAKVGRSGSAMAYDKDVTVYVGTGSDSVNVGSTDDAVNIWMDGQNGSALYGGVKYVNGSSAKGDLIIAGNANTNQSLIGGQGNTYLWGGTGTGNDTLKGGTGTTGYLFGTGEGNDVVQSYKAGDTVWMYNMTVDDLAGAEIDTTKKTITLTTKAGNSLTVQNIDTNSTDFALNFSDGRNFVASKGEWKNA